MGINSSGFHSKVHDRKKREKCGAPGRVKPKMTLRIHEPSVAEEENQT